MDKRPLKAIVLCVVQAGRSSFHAPADAFRGKVRAPADTVRGQERERRRCEAATILGGEGEQGRGFTAKHASAFLRFMFPASDMTKVTLFCNWPSKKRQ